MADNAKRLVGPVMMSTTSTLQYTVPASTQTIVRSLHFANVQGSMMQFSLAINAVSTTVANCLYYLTGVGGYGALDWSGFLVLNAGDTIYAHANTASAITLVICGIEVA